MPNASPSPHGASAHGASITSTAFALTASTVAVAGVAAIWTGVSLIVGSNAGWMCVVAALDAALLLRLAGYPRGNYRALFALFVTLATVAGAGFLIATARIGLPMGLRPSDAVGRMSIELAWLFVQSNSGWVELIWLAIGCVVAWKVGK